MAKKTRQTDAVINFQNNFETIRLIIGMRTTDLAKRIGVSRQNIWNLETGHVIMSVAQYIAFRHLFDYIISQMDDLNRQWQCKLIISSLVDNSEDPDYNWTEEIIRQLTEEEE